jgi:hypothetical protein
MYGSIPIKFPTAPQSIHVTVAAEGQSAQCPSNTALLNLDWLTTSGRILGVALFFSRQCSKCRGVLNTFRDNEVVVYKDADAVGIVLIDFPYRSHNEIPAQNTKLGMEERFVVRRF